MSEERLYYDDAYTTRFSATVVEARRDDQGRACIVLDVSYFYPTSGGQMHDLGRLGDGEVVDVLELGGRVVHVVTGMAPPPPGTRLTGVIDAQRRRTHRQQHTGQHVLSRVFEDRLGLPTSSSRLGESGNTLDLPQETLTWDQLDAIEDEANALVHEGRAVHVRYVAAEDASVAELRKIPQREGRLRVVEVQGHDRSACGGTHVRNTAEIGLIAITKMEKIKGGQRVHFLCGDRALDHRRRRDRLVSGLSQVLTTGEDEMLAAVTALTAEVKACHKRIAQLERHVLASQVATWVGEAEVMGPVRLVARGLPTELAAAASDAAQALMRHDQVVALLWVEEADRTQFLLGHGGNVDLDCGALLKGVLERSGGRGGGQKHYARGAAAPACAGSLVHAVREALRRG